MSQTYSIYEAKTHFSEVLRNVKKGAEVVVTERGAPVAKVIPFQPENLKDHVKRLKKSGYIITQKLKGCLPKGSRRPGALKRFLEERE